MNNTSKVDDHHPCIGHTGMNLISLCLFNPILRNTGSCYAARNRDLVSTARIALRITLKKGVTQQPENRNKESPGWEIINKTPRTILESIALTNNEETLPHKAELARISFPFTSR